MLKINEIFYSIQGESSFAGLPCIFIRTTGCSLRCSYCDTKYAYYEGQEKSIEEIYTIIQKYPCRLALVTGGEPLDQEETLLLMQFLCDSDYTVCIETAGHKDISGIDQRVHIILDMKTPSSLMSKRNDYENLKMVTKKDEVKFVIGNQEDFDWSLEKVYQYDLIQKTNVLFSPIFGAVTYEWLAKRVLDTGLPIRFQIQLHKLIWSPDTRGV